MLRPFVQEPFFHSTNFVPGTVGGRIVSHGATMYNPWNPKSDFVEKNGYYEIYCDLPGVPKESIDLQISGNNLTLTCSKPKSCEHDNDYFLSERRWGCFKKCWFCPLDADCSRIEDRNVHLVNGVVTITIPKKEGTAVRKLQIL